MNNKVTRGIIKKSELPDLVETLVNKLSFSEVKSLLLEVFELKTKTRQLKDVLHEFKSNRFVQPSDIDPILHRKLELKIFSMLPVDYAIIDLSPLTPLGTTSILTTVHQNNVITTIRNKELSADNTNILSLICALKRKELLLKNSRSNQKINLCSSQRVTRAQPFEGKDFSANFNVIALCTAGRDQGNNKFELDSISEHISFYVSIIDEIILTQEKEGIIVKLYEYDNYDNTIITDYIKTLYRHREDISIKTEKRSQFGKNYYTRLRFQIGILNPNKLEYDYVDGGFTTWTNKLLNSKKERLLTSGIGTDYLLRTVKTKTL